MSTFGDYKAYKKFEPSYDSWKQNRDLAEAKRIKYLRLHPEIRNKADIQRGQALLRAIDIMDEYSQKRAEDMEVATESVISMGLEGALIAGAGLGALVSKLKPVKNFILKMSKGNKHADKLALAIPTVAGAILGTIAAFPLMAWGAKAEVAASRKGRFEAMRKELKHPNNFAVLTDEEIKEAEEKSKSIKLKEDEKKPVFEFAKGLKTIKDMVFDSKEYKAQRKQFEAELADDMQNLDKEMTAEEIEAAKRDQQLLTKLVEKIDIASQDYAENAEMATQTAILTVGAAGGAFSFLLNTILDALKIKSAGKISAISKIATVAAMLGTSLFAAQIQKQASRVGRYKVKQELLKNPDNFVYIDDEKISEIKDVKLKPHKKEGMFKFLRTAWKNNKEFEKYKKTTAKEEKRLAQYIETMELSPEQIKEAKKLQKNTFRTFNKIDENSQKYAESIEAIGQAAEFPIGLICTGIGAAIGLPYLLKNSKSQIEAVENFAKYLGAVIISTFPSIGINIYITKQQKKASRIADMLAINEMNDYRMFRG